MRPLFLCCMVEQAVFMWFLDFYSELTIYCFQPQMMMLGSRAGDLNTWLIVMEYNMESFALLVRLFCFDSQSSIEIKFQTIWETRW